MREVMALNAISAANQKTRTKYPVGAIGALEQNQREQVSKCQVEFCHLLSTMNPSALCAAASFSPADPFRPSVLFTSALSKA